MEQNSKTKNEIEKNRILLLHTLFIENLEVASIAGFSDSALSGYNMRPVRHESYASNHTLDVVEAHRAPEIRF